MNGTSLWAGLLVVLVLIIGGFWLYDGALNLPGLPDTTNNTENEENAGSQGNGARGQLPEVETAAFASPTSSTTVVVAGSVNPGGFPTTVWFEYGLTTSFGSRANVQQTEAIYMPIAQAAYVTGLEPGTEYYFRIGAENARGRAYGGVYNFIMPDDDSEL
jgi:hypothetical protein